MAKPKLKRYSNIVIRIFLFDLENINSILLIIRKMKIAGRATVSICIILLETNINAKYNNVNETHTSC